MDEENKTEDQPVMVDAPGPAVIEKIQSEGQLIDGGTVVMMMAVEGQGLIPVPITAIFQQLFGILNHIDSRLVKLEEKLRLNPDGESRIVTLN